MYSAEAGNPITKNRTSHLRTAEAPTQAGAQSDHCASSVSDGKERHGKDFRVQTVTCMLMLCSQCASATVVLLLHVQKSEQS